MKKTIAYTVAAAAAIASIHADASCYKFYKGLCDGPSSCQCTLNEPCGAEGDIARATNEAGKCSGTCHTVAYNKCPGDSSCLEAGPVCGNHSSSTAIECAKTWVAEQVPYCQCTTAECCGTCPYCSTHYRCDCSGFVSYCLGLSYGYTTRSLTQVSHRITKEELQPGDMMLCVGTHVAFFGGWTDSSMTHFVCYQEPGCHNSGLHHAMVSVIPYPFNWNTGCFLPYRVNSAADEVSKADKAAFEASEEGKSALRAHGAFQAIRDANIPKQPFHVPNPNGNAIAPKWLVEEAAKNGHSYPFEHEEEALAAAESSRNHLAKMGIFQP